jgi:hypothetical protein
MVVVVELVVAVGKEGTTATSLIVVGGETGAGGLCTSPTPNVSNPADINAKILGTKSIAFS